MRLSDFAPEYYEVVKNGTFETIGNVTSRPDMPFLSFAENENYIYKICKTEDISCVICTPSIACNKELLQSEKGIAVCNQPRLAMYKLHNWLIDQNLGYIKKPQPTVIGKNCKISATAIIEGEGVIIGNNVMVEDNVIIKSGTTIEDNVIIYAGAIVGGENQIITKDQNGNLFLVRQVGKCHIANDVAIGYHCMISRGTFPYDITGIGAYTKIENSVEISHNSIIGENCIITGQCQVCGNSIVGANSRINPQSVISNQTKIGDNVTVEIGSVVVNDIKNGAKVAGNFAIDHMKFLLWHRKKLSCK